MLDDAVNLLLWTAHIALASVGLTVILRNAPVIRTWVFEVKKPWACNVCMPLYVCALLVGALIFFSGDWHFGLSYLPAYALTNVSLDHMAKPPGPPVIPDDFFEDND